MDQKPQWREPRQARSRQRFAHILDTAARLFAADGYEAVTTNHIAEAAGVSIGSLYQYFPDGKDAVLAALIHRYREDMAAVFPPPQGTLAATIQAMIDNLIAFETTHTAFQQVLYAEPLHHGETVQTIHQSILHEVERLLHAFHPTLTDPQRHRCATACIGIVKGLMILGEPPFRLTPEEMAAETVTALVAYIDAFVQREQREQHTKRERP